jgi:hypothetical protein
MKALSIPEKHQLRIAKDTLKTPDAILAVLGGPSKAEAMATIIRLTGKPPLDC